MNVKWVDRLQHQASCIEQEMDFASDGEGKDRNG